MGRIGKSKDAGEAERSLPFYKGVLGAELRVMGIDPDAAERRAKTAGARILQPAMDFPHGWRDVMLEDPDGYVWAVGVSIP